MAALFLRPDADQSDGSWLNESSSGTNLFASVDESSFSDSDYIQSSTTLGDKVRLRLSDPGSIVSAPFTVRYRCKRGSGNATAGVTGRLFQGTTQIAAWQQTLDDTLTTYTYTLTSPQFSSITDFNDLFVEFEYINPWWLSGSSIDLSFLTSQYYDSSAGGDGQAVATYLSCSRSSVGYAKDSGGTWTSFASNVLRITDLGLLIENAATNNLLNSATPATQTTASLATGDYTLWVEGSGSALASAGSATITGAASATQGAPDTFTVTVAGTVTVTVTGSLTKFQLESGQFPSSFIATTGTTFTRAADQITIAGGLSTLLSALPMTLLADVIYFSTGGSFWHVHGSSPSNHYYIAQDTSHVAISDGSGHSISVDPIHSLSFVTGMKIGASQDVSGRSIVAAGGTVGTDAFPDAITTTQYLGTSSDSFTMYGYIRRLTAWNSKLANATLQGLTYP